MSDTTNTNIPALKLDAGQVVEQLQSYLKQADQSLQQLQNNIDAGTRQLDEWKRMQLILVGQRQVVVDLLNRMIEAPAPAADTNVDSSAEAAAPAAAQ